MKILYNCEVSPPLFTNIPSTNHGKSSIYFDQHKILYNAKERYRYQRIPEACKKVSFWFCCKISDILYKVFHFDHV